MVLLKDKVTVLMTDIKMVGMKEYEKVMHLEYMMESLKVMKKVLLRES